MTHVAGIIAKHAIISDSCRYNKTDNGAFIEACEREEYEALCGIWPIGSRVSFHVVLSIEPPWNSVGPESK